MIIIKKKEIIIEKKMLLDITNLLAEYDDLMHDTFNVLISEYAKDNEEFNNILAYHIKKIKEIAKAEEPNYVYDCYPFLGIMNPYDKNIKALDELCLEYKKNIESGDTIENK